jgi:prepilin-type N-terminal cleavage/methylation domain-containing protein
MKRTSASFRAVATEHGFTLVEVMVSMVIVTIAAISVLSVFGLAVAANQTSQQDMIARQLASEAMEGIFTARNTSQLSWSAIQNVSNGGIFLDNPQTVKCAGADGIIGTADDSNCLTASGALCPGGVQCMTEPGPDGVVGTADDIIVSLNNYTRQIQITPLFDSLGNQIPTLNSVTITIRYYVSNTAIPKTYVLNEYVSQYH